MASLRPALMHLAVTLLFPLLVLQPRLPGLDWGLHQWLTPQGAFMLSAGVPCLYVLWLQSQKKQTSVVWFLLTLSTLLGGLSSLWWTDGLTFAIKDSAGSLFLATSTLFSMLLRRPLFGFVLEEYLRVAPGNPASALSYLHSAGRRWVWASTWVLFAKGLVVAALNISVKHQTVTAAFGTPEFNSQLAVAVAWMVPVAYLSTTVAYSLIGLIWRFALGANLRFPFTPQVWRAALEHRARSSQPEPVHWTPQMASSIPRTEESP